MRRPIRNSILVISLFVLGALISVSPLLAETDSDQLMLLRGDLNGDYIVDVTDAIMAMQILIGFTPEGEIFMIGDVDRDEKVGLVEVPYILQVIAQIREPSVVPCWTVTFKDHDGTVLKAETVEHGDNATAPDEPILEGHTFIGWDVPFDMVTVSLTVTAQYTVNRYTVIFDTQGGGVVEPITGDYDTEVTIPEGSSRDGHTFLGWNDSPDGSGVSYAPGDTFVLPVDGLTLYSQWSINDYTLVYTAGGHGSVEGDLLQTVSYGSDGSPVEAIPDEGWYFLEWSDGSTDNPRTDTDLTGDVNVTATFAIIDPNTPKSLDLATKPNTILNDGNDQSTLTATIIPHDGGIIPDGTKVDFEIISGTANLDPFVASSINGKATTKVTSTEVGTVSIRAQVRETDVFSSSDVKITSSFSTVISVTQSSGGSILNGVYQAGYQFTLRIGNKSDRMFSVDKFEFKNGTVMLKSTTDLSLLNEGQLAPDESISLTVSLGTAMHNNGFMAVYYLSEPNIQNEFTVSYHW